MNIRTLKNLLGLGLLWANLAASAVIVNEPESHQPSIPDKAQVASALAHLSVPFEANMGQTDTQVAFQARTLAGPLFVTKTGELVWNLSAQPKNYPLPKLKSDNTNNIDLPPVAAEPSWTVIERFHNGQPQPIGAEPQATKVNYFIGNDNSKWQQGVPTYGTVHLGAVWPGIEVSLSARGNNVEKLFTLAPGADPNAIQLAVAGGELSINTGGSLEVAHGDKPLVSFTSPIAWQINTDGTKQAVRVNYRLAGNSRQIYGFSLENYDATRPVFIDPIIQSTYLGGTNADYIHALAVTNNAVYVAGYTYSTNFPQTSGSAQSTSGGGNYDGIIAKLNLELTSIIQSSYLGGTSDDYINAIATNNEAVYVTGYTTSTDFPQTSGGAQPNHGGGYRDGIVAKLNLDLTSVMQNSYLGGSNSDHLRALAVTSEAVYVSGQTTSTDFPETSGGAQPAGGLVDDGIIVKLDLGLTNIIQGSYLGGSRSDYIYALVATSDAVYVAGYTRSDDFPRTNGGAQPNWGGGTYYLNNFLSYYSDGIIAKLNLGLTSILQSSYLGSVGEDHIYALAVTNDAVYVAGDAGSLTFPAISNGAQPAHGGGTNDGMVARLNLELTNVIQSSYLGGSNSDVINALAITDESVYVTGYTWSTNFPTTSDGVQTNYGGGSYDGMITKLNLGLTSIVQSSYLGGIGYDELKTIVITNDGVYVAGSTSSNNFPRTSGGVQPASGGNWDGIITKITLGINAFCQQCLPNHGGWRAILR